MSELIRWSLSVDEETVEIVARWKHILAPRHRKRSPLVCELLKLWDRVAMDQRLNPLIHALQELNSINSSYSQLESQLELNFSAFPVEKKPPTRACPPKEGLGRRLAYSANRRTGAVAMAREPLSLLAMYRYAKFSTYGLARTA